MGKSRLVASNPMKFLIVPISLIATFGLFVIAANAYRGHVFYYILFSILFNVLLVFGFRTERTFFDTFMGIFLWLGFWLKFSLRTVFFNGAFNEVAGTFGFDGLAWDRVLVVSSCGAGGLLVASWLRQKFFFNYNWRNENEGLISLYQLYLKYRKSILISFALCIVVIASTNFYFGIYQRGVPPRAILPYGLSGVYTWLLLFGLSSFSALMVDFELRTKNSPYLIAGLSLFETFMSSTSLLSRAMIMNSGAIGLGYLVNMKRKYKQSLSVKFVLFTIGLFLILFGTSVLIVNIYRAYNFFDEKNSEFSEGSKDIDASTVLKFKEEPPGNQNLPKKDGGLQAQNTLNLTKTLFVDRFVGIEGVMAVSSFSGLGWDLWRKAWKEKFSNSGTSMYDSVIMKSPNVQISSKYHFISLPGIIAFFFYPGSFVFLFIAMVIVGLLGASVEYFAYQLCEGNFLLSSLFAQVVAYRFSNFGYVPMQTYLLFGTIVLNIIIIGFLNRVLSHLRVTRLTV